MDTMPKLVIFAVQLYIIMKLIFTVLMGFAFFSAGYAQNQQYRASIVGFYNLENLFDTVDNPQINDEEFLPDGIKGYNTRIYQDKLNRLATVISQMGTEITPDGMAILGVSEVENDTVLNDLIHTTPLKNRSWKMVHYNSPDIRGVDVALLYNPKYFSVLHSESVFVKLPSGSKSSYFTRDVLYVKGLLDGDTVHVLVNHWPSRSGGEERSMPARAAAASVCKRIIDSVMQINPDSKLLLMGDLNDDPVSPSLTKTLGAKSKVKSVGRSDIYNPWVDMYKRGIGTSAYQDAWGLFDQVLLSQAWLPKDRNGYFFHKAVIFNKDFMIQKTGKYKGYSKRTWNGNIYNYGYSDHFPVYLIMLKTVIQ